MKLKALFLGAAIAGAASAGIAAAQDAPIVTEPQAFAEMAASSNMFEIESSQLALEMAQDDEIRAYAEHMIEDHTAAGEKMEAAASSDGVTPPAGMTEAHAAMVEQLQAAPEGEFDAAYVAAQVAAHEEAVALFDAFANQGEQSALRDFAAETLPTLQNHREELGTLEGT